MGLVFVLAIYALFVHWLFSVCLALALAVAVARPVGLPCPGCGHRRLRIALYRPRGDRHEVLGPPANGTRTTSRSA